MGNPDAFTSRVFVNAIRAHPLGLWQDWFCTEYCASDGIILCAVHHSLTSCSLMLLSDTAAALCTLTILFVWLSGNLELWHLYLVNAITGTAQTFQQPASEVATTLVTPDDKYQKAGSLNALAYSVINMASPVIATALYSVGGLTLVIIVDLSTFTVAFLSLLFFVRIPEMQKKKYEDNHIMMDLKEALSFLRANMGILQVILFLAAINLIASIYNAALPAMILSFESESVLAAVQSTAGIAMIIGSAIAAMLPTPKSRVRMIILSLFISMSTENFMLAFFRNPIMWCVGAFEARSHQASKASVFSKEHAPVLHHTAGLSCGRLPSRCGV